MSQAFIHTVADTLSDVYSDRWSGAPGEEHSNVIVQIMSSNDLILVVLAVSLIIWFVLAFYLIRVDKKISRLEKQITENSSTP